MPPLSCPFESSTLAELGADAASLTDTSAEVNIEYSYRVKATAASDSSGYSNVATATLTATPTITVLAPAEGDEWTIGAVEHIRWTASNIDGVQLYYSVDGGETLVLITDSSVAVGSDEWGDYPWRVPSDLSEGQIIIIVQEYGNPSLASYSTLVPLRASSVVGMPGGEHAFRQGIRVTANGTIRAHGRGAHFHVFSLDGRRRGAVRPDVPYATPTDGVVVVRPAHGATANTRTVVLTGQR